MSIMYVFCVKAGRMVGARILICTIKLLPKHMEQITISQAVQVHVVVENV